LPDGMATPMEEAMSLCGSFVEFLAKTRCVISPGLRSLTPRSKEMSLQPGGMILDTFTRFSCWIFASLRANSKD